MEKRIITFLSFEELPPEKQLEKAKQWRSMYEENFLFEDAMCSVTRGMECIPLPDAWKDEDGTIIGCPDFKWEEVAEIVRCQHDVYNPRQNKTEKKTFIQFQTPWYGSHNVTVEILDLYYRDFLVPVGETKRQFDDFDFLRILGFPKEYKEYFDQLLLENNSNARRNGNGLISIELDPFLEEDMESEDPVLAAEAKRLMDGFPEALRKVQLNFGAWISFLEKDLSTFFKGFYEMSDNQLIERYKESMDLSDVWFFENGDFVTHEIYGKTEPFNEIAAKEDAEIAVKENDVFKAYTNWLLGRNVAVTGREFISNLQEWCDPRIVQEYWMQIWRRTGKIINTVKHHLGRLDLYDVLLVVQFDEEIPSFMNYMRNLHPEKEFTEETLLQFIKEESDKEGFTFEKMDAITPMHEPLKEYTFFSEELGIDPLLEFKKEHGLK